MCKTLITVCMFVGCFSVLTQAASFDCAKVSTKTEKLICSDAKISVLDEQLTAAYKTASETATDKDALKTQQRDWLKQKRNVCTDVDCLAKVYQSRIDELTKNAVAKNEISAASSAAAKPTDNFKKPLTFKLVFGDSYPICQPYVNMLNEAKYDSNPVCERKILPEFPQFKSLQWTEIMDKQEIEKIVEANQRTHYEFMRTLLTTRTEQSFKNSMTSYKELIASGEYKLYFTKFDIDKDGKQETVYKGTAFWGGHNGVAKEYNLCNLHNEFFVKDEKITLENIPTKYLSIDPYYYMNFDGHNDLFSSKDGQLFSSHWVGQKAYDRNYNLYIYTNHSSLTCGINIIQ